MFADSLAALVPTFDRPAFFEIALGEDSLEPQELLREVTP
jgi:hypothetical protein